MKMRAMRVQPAVAKVSRGEGFGEAFGLVVDAPYARRADVAAVVFVLRVDKRIAVDLRGRGEQEAGAFGQRDLQGVVGASRARQEHLYRDALEVRNGI